MFCTVSYVCRFIPCIFDKTGGIVKMKTNFKLIQLGWIYILVHGLWKMLELLERKR
jgi:hypothetical protein